MFIKPDERPLLKSRTSHKCFIMQSLEISYTTVSALKTNKIKNQVA